VSRAAPSLGKGMSAFSNFEIVKVKTFETFEECKRGQCKNQHGIGYRIRFSKDC
jgi:hypothetical protein